MGERERKRREEGEKVEALCFHFDALLSLLLCLAAIEARLFFFAPSIETNLSFSHALSLSSFFFEKPSLFSNLRKKPSVDGGAAGAAVGAPKKDFTTAILERKKSPNRLIVDDATNDDNR